MGNIDHNPVIEQSLITLVLGYIRLIHPIPVFFVMVGTAAFGVIASGGIPDQGRFSLMLLAMLGGQVAIGAHNEWRDREHDARHQPEKPIPAGLVDPRHVPPIVGGGLVLAVVTGSALGLWPLLVLILGTGCGFFYNIRLKRTPLSGVPYLIGLPLLPIWAVLIMDEFEPRLLWLYPLGGAYVIAIHLAQSLSDITGDRASGTRGLAVVLGRRRTEQTIWAIAVNTAVAMPVGAFLAGDRWIYGLVSGLVALSISGWFLVRRKRRGRVPNSSLFAVLCIGAAVLAAGWILSVTG